jgi:hypothetical protein
MEHIFVLEGGRGGRCAAQQAGLPTDKLLSKLLPLFMKLKDFLTT